MLASSSILLLAIAQAAMYTTIWPSGRASGPKSFDLNRVEKQRVDQGSVRSDSPPLDVAATREISLTHVNVSKPCVIHKV